MSVTIDELLNAITEFQTECNRAGRNRQWEKFITARVKLRAWIEEHQLPVTFPQEDPQ